MAIPRVFLASLARSSARPPPSLAFTRAMSSFASNKPRWTPNNYPAAPRLDHFDTYKSASRGEVKVHDPYRWLEEPGKQTDDWVTAQVEHTNAYLHKNQDRDRLRSEVRQNWDYAKFSSPSLKRDNRWYWYYNSGLKAQSIVYRSTTSELPNFEKEDGPGGEVFFDPNLLSNDGTAALATTAFSHSGEYFAYGVSLSGSDFFTIYVRPTSAPFPHPEHDGTNTLDQDGRLPDEIRYVKFSGITWTHDSKGFFYQRYPTRVEHGDATEDKAGTETLEDKHAMLYYHRIGTPQSEDVLVIQDEENPTYMWSTGISEEDGRYLELYISKDTSRTNQLWVTDLTQNEIGPNMKWDKLVDEFESEYNVVANDGPKFYLYTNKDAPKYRVVTLDTSLPAGERKLVDFIPEDSDALLSGISPVNERNFVVVYSRNVKDELHIYSPTGKHLKRILQDHVGSISVTAKRKQSWFFVQYSGFTNPGVVGKYEFAASEKYDGAGEWNVLRAVKLKGLVPDEFVAEQVWYESKDGTKVPMFIVRHKSVKQDGTAPAIQYGYGGFSISINPSFSPSILTFIKAYGAVYAVPNIRGGAEFGEEWHLAGTREKKINVFDDFIAATQYLVKHKYVAPGKVAINGASNGGLLIAACIHRAPEGTFGAAVAEVGVMDMLRFTKFTIGKAWTSDYGNPEDPTDFDFIYPYSPVHNVPKDKKLPPTILLTADHDDRVVPLHSFKYAAALQHDAAGNPDPLLIRVDKKSGHGSGKSTEKRIEEATDKWGFVAQSMGLTWKDEAPASTDTVNATSEAPVAEKQEGALSEAQAKETKESVPKPETPTYFQRVLSLLYSVIGYFLPKAAAAPAGGR